MSHLARTPFDRLRALLLAEMGGALTPALCERIERAAWEAPDLSIDVGQFEPQQFNGLVIQAERFSDALPELERLHAEHWAETEKHRHGLAMNPDYDALLARERAGGMLQFTMRREGDLVGHVRMYVCRSLHTKTLFGEEDTLFIRHECRGGLAVIRLMRYAEAALRKIGCREIRADSKLLNRADVLMRRLGYQPVALKFHKFFED